jgi:hypothetical protein
MSAKPLVDSESELTSSEAKVVSVYPSRFWSVRCIMAVLELLSDCTVGNSHPQKIQTLTYHHKFDLKVKETHGLYVVRLGSRRTCWHTARRSLV